MAIIAGDSAKAREDGLGGGLATTDELSQTNNSIDVVNTAETDSASELWSEIDSEGFSESEGESESDSDSDARKSCGLPKNTYPCFFLQALCTISAAQMRSLAAIRSAHSSNPF